MIVDIIRFNRKSSYMSYLFLWTNFCMVQLKLCICPNLYMVR